MTKSDDFTIPAEHRLAIRKHAHKALNDASALGRFPTPIAEVMEAAKVVEAPKEVLDDGFFSRWGRRTGIALKKALSKVLGVLDAAARIIYIDRAVPPEKLPFLRLHETGHAVLPWQSELYAACADCEKTLAPDVSDLFEREANTFASEVLFQLDAFSEEAASYDFGVKAPLKLAKKYGASVYSSVRRYVTGNARACVVLVLNPPELVPGDGFRASLRRAVSSPLFAEHFGDLDWPEVFTPGDQIGAMIPVNGRRMSGKRTLPLRDRNGTLHDCIAEAFTQTYQVFILIHPVKALTRVSVVLPA